MTQDDLPFEGVKVLDLSDTLGRVPMGTLCGQRPPATGDRLTHAPHLGEHTREILREMGYGAADIEKLTASGVVACYGD